MAFADRFPRARRISSFILVLAAIVVYFGVVAPRAGEDHAVNFEFQGPTASITRVEAVWTKVGDREDEPTAGATFNFEAGRAPRTLNTSIHAANGEYWLDLTIFHGVRRSNVQRRITLPGALFLGMVAIMPFLLGLLLSAFNLGAASSQTGIFLVSSSGLLIVVGVVRDTFMNIDAELKLHGYQDSLLVR